MRKEAIEGGDEVMKFISYSNVDPNIAKESSKLSHGSGSPPRMGQLSPSYQLNSGDLPNLNKIVLNQNQADANME